MDEKFRQVVCSAVSCCFAFSTIVSVFGAGAAPFLTAPAPAPAPSKPFQRLRLRLRLQPKCVGSGGSGSGGSGSGSGSGSASLDAKFGATLRAAVRNLSRAPLGGLFRAPLPSRFLTISSKPMQVSPPNLQYPLSQQFYTLCSNFKVQGIIGWPQMTSE